MAYYRDSFTLLEEVQRRQKNKESRKERCEEKREGRRKEENGIKKKFHTFGARYQMGAEW
jgi:hypothetical protein